MISLKNKSLKPLNNLAVRLLILLTMEGGYQILWIASAE